MATVGLVNVYSVFAALKGGLCVRQRAAKWAKNLSSLRSTSFQALYMLHREIQCSDSFLIKNGPELTSVQEKMPQ